MQKCLFIDISTGTVSFHDDYIPGTGLGETKGTFANFERVAGSKLDNLIYGSEGRDKIYGLNGDDYIRGWGGNVIMGQDGNDKSYGGKGDDVIWSGEGKDRAYGGQGDDFISGANGSDRLYGGSEADFIAASDRALNGTNDYFYGGTNVIGDSDLSDLHRSQADTLSYLGINHFVIIDAENGLVTGDGAGVPVVTTDRPFTQTLLFTDTFTGFERFIGSRSDDKFYASSDASVSEFFEGDQGDDLFFANKGIEHYDGGSPDDKDGEGFDSVNYSRADGRVEITLRTGEGTLFDNGSPKSCGHT